MLTHFQFNEYRRFKTLNNFYDVPANAAIIITFVPFKDRVTIFKSNFATLDSLLPKKDVDGKGITTDKATLKHTISDALAILCRKTRAYALTNNLGQLASDMNVNASKINHVNDEDFEAFVNTKTGIIAAQIPDAAFTPYGIVAGDLTAIDNQANDFNNAIGQATTATSAGTVANTDINKAIKLLEADIIIFDLLIEHFRVTNPDFFQGYHINSTVEDIGVHHTTLEGTTIPGTIIKAAGKEVTADINGHYSITRLKAGDILVEATAPGKPPISQVVRITRGHTQTVNFLIFP